MHGVALTLAWVVTAQAPGSPPRPPAALEAVAAKMRTLISLQVDMRQEKEMAIFGETLRSRGTLVLARPRRLAMDLDGAGGSTLVIDGDRMAMHYKALDKTERFDLTKDPRAKAIADHLFLLLDADAAGLQETYALEVAATEPLQITLTPKPEALRRIIAQVTLRFDRNHFVDKLIIQEAGGDRTIWWFDDPVVDRPIDPERFSLARLPAQ